MKKILLVLAVFASFQANAQWAGYWFADTVDIMATKYDVASGGGGGGTTYTFSTGLNESGGTVTNKLSTGVSGGQSVVGGTGASEFLTLSTTTNGTKGKIIMGNSAYNEANNRLGLGIASPGYQLHSYSNTTSYTVFHGMFENENQAGRAQVLIHSGDNFQNFFSLMTHGTTYSANDYATSIGASSDAGKAIVLGQGSNITEMLIGTYNSKPISLFTNNTARFTIPAAGIADYADNAAAVAAGLSNGMVYRTGDVLKIVHP